MKRNRWILLLILLLVGIYLYSHRASFYSTNTEKSIPVTASSVIKKDVMIKLESIGQVLPISTVTITPQVSGKLLKVNFKEGDTVTSGQVLFEIDPRSYETSLAQTEAQLSHDQALLWSAQLLFDRSAVLRKKGALSQQDYDQVKSNAQSLSATVKSDQALVQQAKLNLDYCTIVSPVTGRTGNLLVNSGNIVTANSTALVTINQIQPIYISFAIPENKLSDIQEAFRQQNAITVTTVTKNHHTENGKLVFINNTIDNTTGTIQLKAVFDNQDNQLWPGQFVTVHIPLKKISQALIIPVEAVQQGQQGAYVYRIDDHQRVKYTPIITGPEVPEGVVIEKGLNMGEKVVTSGQLKLTDGSKVSIE